MTNKQTLVELIVEAKSVNRDDNRLSFLQSKIENDLDKLEELRLLNNELGINIVSSINLCKRVNSQRFVYTKENWGISKLNVFDDLDLEVLKHRLYSNSRGLYVSLDLYKYGVDWALTKEELKNEDSKN